MAAPQAIGSLQFSISGGQMRKFKTALQSLSKIGTYIIAPCSCMWRYLQFRLTRLLCALRPRCCRF